MKKIVKFETEVKNVRNRVSKAVKKLYANKYKAAAFLATATIAVAASPAFCDVFDFATIIDRVGKFIGLALVLIGIFMIASNLKAAIASFTGADNGGPEGAKAKGQLLVGAILAGSPWALKFLLNVDLFKLSDAVSKFIS